MALDRIWSSAGTPTTDAASGIAARIWQNQSMSIVPVVKTMLEAIEPVAASAWLRPDGLLTGAAAQEARAQGLALPLAGGAAAFTMVEVLARRGDDVAVAIASLPRLRGWISRLDIKNKAHIETQLVRASERRPDWAGLRMDRPLVMGIVNATPDSFYFGSGTEPQPALALGRAMLDAGADIIDIGAESTRPGAAPVSEEEELHRLEPVIRGLAGSAAVISVDTRHARVMDAALGWGARAINDVAALEGDGSLETAARRKAPVVLMHMRGEPDTMQHDPRYALASIDVADYLAARIARCEAAGIPRDRIVVDPGFGFGKTPAHNLEIMARLTLLHSLGCGVLVGLSRKSTIGRVAGGAPVEQRLPGSLAGALQAVRQGVQIIRVHDVAETKQAIAIWQAIAEGASA